MGTADDRNPLHSRKDPKLWELYDNFLFVGNAGFISPTVVITMVISPPEYGYMG